MPKNRVKQNADTRHIGATNVKANHNNEHYDRINIRVSKGRKDILAVHATNRGESLNAFINRAIDNQLLRDG